MKNPYDVILHPHITEKTAALSYGNPRLPDEENIRTYTFVVDVNANKVEIKNAFEQICNAGKAKENRTITVSSVRVVKVKGKTRRVGAKAPGKRPDIKKAVITLGKGQQLEDYGV